MVELADTSGLSPGDQRGHAGSSPASATQDVDHRMGFNGNNVAVVLN